MSFLVMYLKNFLYLTFVLLILIIPNYISAQNNDQFRDIQDGNIGDDQLIVITESVSQNFHKGFFVLNRGKAVEEVHPFSIDLTSKNPFLQSDLFVGPVKTVFKDSINWKGKLKLVNRKKRFLFFHPKVNFDLALRPKTDIIPGKRYQHEIFDSVEVKSNLVYGKALGYWTSSPYSDEPYIVTLGKGIIKTFKDDQPLDLKLDLYFSRTDTLKKKPLVMLIHGGAFYIGSKESACEQALAFALAKRGYIVASIDYRLGFKPTQSDIQMGAYRAIQDAHAALRYLSHHSNGIGFDPDHIYVGGTSAGAVASLNVAFMTNDERPDRILENEKKGLVKKIEEAGNLYKETFSIKGVANMWGAVGDLDIIDPDEKIPVLSIHGTADDVVPFDYDFPFKNSLMVNRVIMNKMYGSKPIHDRLNSLGIRNRLVALQGLGHEPELEKFNKLNNYMDTLIFHTTKFFYEETAPQLFLPVGQLSVAAVSPLKSIYYEVLNGSVVEIQAEGGVKANANPTDATIIWYDKAENKKLRIISVNKFDAWGINEFHINVVRQ